MIPVLIIVTLAVGGFILASDASGEDLSSGSGGILTAQQIAQYAALAGFSGEDLVTAVAIAMAESSGNTNAQGDLNDPIDGQYNSFGLWQINIGENPQFANDNLTDPQINANDAYAIYEAWGSKFGAWSTYNGGQYQAFLNSAQNGANSLG